MPVVTFTWRVDYAAEEHPYWLSLETEMFSDHKTAIKAAQNKIERWGRCNGWRIVPTTEEPFQRIKDEHVFHIVVEGQRVFPQDG